MDQKNNSRRRLYQAIGTKLSHRREITGTSVVIMAAIFLTINLGGSGQMPGYKWRQTLYVDSLMVKTDTWFSDFPIYIKMTEPHLKSVEHGGKIAQNKGYDIRFTGSDGATHLPVFIEKYDPQKGELIAWVGLDTLYAGKRTKFYMYYGNTSVNSPATEMIETERLRGYFLDQKIQESGTSEVYPPEWLETEALNRTHPGDFVIAGEPENVDRPVPADYAYMKAELKGSNMVLVEWGTQGENDNESFLVEKSQDGRHFEQINKMAGGRRTRAALGYSYSDAQPYRGKTYYRLKQLSNTGDFSYTPTLLVNYNPDALGLQIKSVEPLNFSKDIHVFMNSDKTEAVKMQLYTESGNLLWEGATQNKPGENSFSLPNAGSYPPGRYVLSVIGENRKLKTFLLTKEK
ncbi:MAG: DUF2341 domain-containing protein [Bacteroidia bacterium]|nr:DUF2341 domain-containing protein [Bacteroidia bacterium]